MMIQTPVFLRTAAALLVGAAVILSAPQAYAFGSILSAFEAKYPASNSGTNASCQLCHGSSTSTWDEYGWGLKNNGRNFAALEGLPSININGGTTMLDEINASTQPGWTTGAINNLYDSDGLISSTATAPGGIGQLDPSAPNLPPVADANGPYTGEINMPVSFDGSGSSDPDGMIVAYDWDFGDGATGSGVNPSHTYTVDGTYSVTLTVTDDGGAMASDSTTATITLPANLPPVSDPNGPYSGTAGVPVIFDGSGSSDPDGTIVAYDWDFGDGNTGSGVSPSHTYAVAGNYTVSLMVTDDFGATDTQNTTASIVAAPLDPIADPNGPYTGTVGVAVAFDGSGSFDPDGGNIQTYDWDFGDGNTGSGVSPSHSYALDGFYTVSLTVTDDEGATSAPAETTADIGPVPPQPPVSDPNGPYTGTEGVPVVFDGSGSSDPDGTLVSYDWDFGDGNTGTGISPSHTYAAAGNYTVSLTVTDDSGLTDTATTTASIAAGPQPPVADPNGPYTGTVGSPVQFDGTGSFDPDGGSIVSYAWDFGDGNTGTGATPTHTYGAAGTYAVSLTVTDDEGVSDTGTTSATIADLGPVDLDIKKFQVSKNVRLGRKSVRINLTVNNGGDVDEPAQAVITGVQNGNAVYSQARDVSDAPGKGSTRWDFPPFTPTTTGNIDWTATIADGDPDDDTATATTTVK